MFIFLFTIDINNNNNVTRLISRFVFIIIPLGADAVQHDIILAWSAKEWLCLQLARSSDAHLSASDHLCARWIRRTVNHVRNSPSDTISTSRSGSSRLDYPNICSPAVDSIRYRALKYSAKAGIAAMQHHVFVLPQIPDVIYHHPGFTSHRLDTCVRVRWRLYTDLESVKLDVRPHRQYRLFATRLDRHGNLLHPYTPSGPPSTNEASSQRPIYRTDGQSRARKRLAPSSVEPRSKRQPLGSVDHQLTITMNIRWLVCNTGAGRNEGRSYTWIHVSQHCSTVHDRCDTGYSDEQPHPHASPVAEEKQSPRWKDARWSNGIRVTCGFCLCNLHGSLVIS